jgi:hypothetical protein
MEKPGAGSVSSSDAPQPGKSASGVLDVPRRAIPFGLWMKRRMIIGKKNEL